MSKRKPIRITVDLNFRDGDRVEMLEPPFFRGVISGVVINLDFGTDNPQPTYRVATETPKRVSRYVGEGGIRLLHRVEEAK